ncbi:MAG: hypothetical protein MUC83_08055 [Pirellula sp.]|nr:hypothetical protein [Pirellula sp.]
MNTDLQCDVNTMRDLPRRHHSKQLVAALESWDSLIGQKDSTDVEIFRSASVESLQNIVAEASFLGFPQTIKLARAILAAIEPPNDSKPLSPEKCHALGKAFVSLKQLVCNQTKEMQGRPVDIIRELQSTFLVTDEQLSEPLDLEMNALPEELTSGLQGDHSFTEHRDLDVYRNSRLDSLDQCFEEESWIVSQLASLAEDLSSGTHCSHPASRLMHVLKNHKLFYQVDRVCLVGRVAGANQLVVVDASTSDRCPENSLKKGYSCFVNPEGSLFKMRPGTVRMFGDCERVLSSFAAQGKPAQRSIALISDLGLRSGLCLALGRGAEVQGFLFLNSVQEDLFREISINSAPILSLFGLIATITLDTSGFHPLPKNHPQRNDIVPKSSTSFEPSRFKELLENALALRSRPGIQRTVKINLKDETLNFLYLPTTIINSLAELICKVHDVNHVATIDIGVSNGLVHIGFDHDVKSNDSHAWAWLSRIVQTLDSEFANKPVSIKMSESQVTVEFPFEPLLVGHKSLLYSTVF